VIEHIDHPDPAIVAPTGESHEQEMGELDVVVMVTPRWARDGGVGAHVVASAALLAAHGLRVYVLAARLEFGEELEGVTICHRPELFNASVAMKTRLGGELPARPSLVHLHQVDDPEIVAAMRALAPVVLSAHAYTACTSGVYYFGPGQECTRAHGPGCVPNLIARGCAHTRYPKTLPAKYRSASRGLRALQLADLAVSYSSAVDRHLAANGIAHRAVVPYVPTMAAAQGSGHETRRRVVFAGRMVRPKGVGVLIRAAREVDGEFVLCGDGRELEAMRELTRRLGVQERVQFRGWLDGSQLASELAEASVVAMPSLWPEPFGIVGIEAFAAGRPAVASATGGIGDWLEHGVNGLAVPPANAEALARALNELLADTDMQRRMGLAGREMVARRFSGEQHLSTLLEAYRRARSSWQGRLPVAA
jgi:glycosyltransferase involved in cell wall biosynthesis